MKRIFSWGKITIVTLAAMSVTACNTIHGAGQDIESAGGAIADAAK